MRSSFKSLGVALFATLAGVATTACSSSPAPGTTADCSMSMPVSGAITATLSGDGCGNVGGNGFPTTINFSSGDFLGGGELTTTAIAFGVPLTGGQTGTFATSVEISRSGGDAGDLTWQTPATACSVTITGNVSSPDSSGVIKNKYDVDGHGTCSQPATATAGQTGGGSITISAFTFHGFISAS
jgi:hypothetical protein